MGAQTAKRKRVTLNLKQGEWRELRKRAKAAGCSMSDYLRPLLLDDLSKRQKR